MYLAGSDALHECSLRRNWSEASPGTCFKPPNISYASAGSWLGRSVVAEPDLEAVGMAGGSAPEAGRVTQADQARFKGF